MKVTIADGKYTVVCDEVKGLRALRYGEEWRDLTGDNLVAELALEIEELRAAIESDRKRRGEPVAWIRKNGFRFISEIEPQDDSEVPLYAAPQPADPCASSVSNKTACGSENGDCDSQPADPQQVVPLTDERIKKLYEVLGSEITLTVVPAIEKQGSLGLPVEA